MSVFAEAYNVEAPDDAIFVEAVVVEEFDGVVGQLAPVTVSPIGDTTYTSPPPRPPRPPRTDLPSTVTQPPLELPPLPVSHEPAEHEVPTMERPDLAPIPEPVLDPTSIRHTLHIYENERYLPRVGFSTRGLMANDRGPYSNHEGTMSFSTLEEATQSLLSKGWQYCDAEWMVDGDNGLRTTLSSVSSPPPSTGKSGGGGGGAEDWASGWQYSVDFGGFQQNQGSSKKGMTHFVRRRKLVRTVQFDETSIGNNSRQTCQNCDLKSQLNMAELMLHKLYAAVRGRYGPALRPHKIAKMKSQLIDALFALPQNTYNPKLVEQQLNEFVTEQTKGIGRSAPHTFPPYSQTHPDGALLYASFPLSERKAIVRALIRKHDLSYQLHCADPYCGTRCPFAVHHCPNPGCDDVFCLRDWPAHDAQCSYKEVPCVQLCGLFVSRRGMRQHTVENCIMRRVPCPYARCGCEPPGLVFRDVEAHCSVNHEYHLALSTWHLNTLLQERDQLARNVLALQTQESLMRQQQGRRLNL